MDIIIKRIIDVDKRAEEIEQETEKKILQDKKRNDADIKAIREQMISNAKKQGEDRYKSAIDNALTESQRIKLQAEIDCKELDKKFKSIKHEVEQKAFQLIMNGQDGEAK